MAKIFHRICSIELEGAIKAEALQSACIKFVSSGQCVRKKAKIGKIIGENPFLSGITWRLGMLDKFRSLSVRLLKR